MIREAPAPERGQVILVGGMTRMPRVQQLVKEVFGSGPDGIIAK